MKPTVYLVTLLIGLSTLAGRSQSASPGNRPPATPQQPVVDVYFGKAITDPYRWLEDLSSPQTQAWFKTQGDYTNAVLDQIPGRNKLIETFVEYDKRRPVRYGEIRKRGNHYFYRKTLPSEKVGKLYMREGKKGTEQLLFDPVAFDKGKTYSVAGFMPSPDGRQMVIGLQEGGAELATIRILQVATKTFAPERITAVQGGGVDWLPDGSGFFYTPRNSTDVNDRQATLNTKNRLHRLGTDPATDPDLFSRAKYPNLGIRADQYPILFYSDDETQLYGYLSSVDQRMDAWVASPNDLTKPVIGWKRLAAPTDSITSFLKLGNLFYLQSIKGAPNGQILATDTANPNPAQASVVLAEGKLNITRMVASKDYLFITLNDGINDRVRQYDPRTKQWTDVPIPFQGIKGVWTIGPKSNEMIGMVMSWNNPGTLYDYNPDTHQLTTSAFHVPASFPGLSDLIVEELEIPSHDGTLVPLSLIYRKGLKKDGSAICYMTGYGAYGASALPYFNPRMLALMNQGVLIAETHPRGGSERGQNWYKAGFKMTKPNTWKDFIASGDYLIKAGYTSPGKLIGEGTSAGGILIGRAITERPDLFAAAITNVGVNNALRMENSPNGPVNTPEFGTVNDSTECMALYEMDAVQHVREGVNYPAVISVAGMNDPRVIAWQPGKFAAALQNATRSGKPVLLQVNYDNGHFTEDKQVTFRNFANMFAFALWQAGHPDFQPAARTAQSRQK